VVDNRASASGVVAGQIVATAPPDGNTLLLAYHQHTINAAVEGRLPYHAVDAFTPITQLTSAGFMLLVHPSSPVRTLEEFVAWTKRPPEPLNYGSAGIGSGGHLAGELYKLMAGVQAEHIPYKGSSPSLMDLVAGRHHFTFAATTPAQPLTRAGKLRGLAVTSRSRLAAIADLPPMADALPGFEVVGWYGVIGPAGLPQPVVTRLREALVATLALADVRERIANDGGEVIGSTPDDFRQFMHADVRKWQRLVKEAGLKLE
jgi:tripartite-type tricarboxylate transporter receptor subunit TctC